MTRVALLWHMHQPFYEDLVTREHILPWARLHALKDYYGMVALLREFPDVRVTFNLVPSLLVQLEAFAAGRARDSYLDLGLKPASDLSDTEIGFILDNFFHAQRQRMIEVYPRYNELLERRGRAAPAPAERHLVAARFSVDDLRDLQIWQKLAWMDPFYLTGDARIRALVAKGRDFTEDDKAALRVVELELLNRVIPEYRDAAARGQIEISTSPFYHPILPLLCDTDIYLRTHPHSAMPRQRFQHPEDALEQLERAAACHLRLFGRRPVGLWPSEGSVSDAIVPLVASAGFKWMATDEQILARSLDLSLTRNQYGYLEQPERLYTPYRIRVGGSEVACAFRDHALSDMIGFNYSGWDSEAAASHFLQRLSEAGRHYSLRTSGEEALISVILDGENAWEHFEGGGRPFLRALYRQLSQHRDLRTVTMAEACTQATRELSSIFPGSWIDANFYIWIGHRDDQLAWGQLADAREALASSGQADAAAIEQAHEEILVAEGSDWCWWYGDDHSSGHDLEFDDLFRRHLRNVYRLLGKPVPEELFASNISTGAATPKISPPLALLSPTLDGEETSYFEWLGAGAYDIHRTAGAMHQTEAPPPVLTRMRFGFGVTDMFVRFEGAEPLVDYLLDGYEVTLAFLQPPGLRVTVRRQTDAAAAVWSAQDPATQSWTDRGSAGTRVAAGHLIELALSRDVLGVVPGTQVQFFITVSRRATSGPATMTRYPEHRPVAVTVPDEAFAAENWQA
jgi:alpha-amylase/alpha-mannosidase (GH57 family)